MAEKKGIFTEKEEVQIAKFVDNLIDFNELLGKKKIMLVVKIGKFIEKRDDKLIQKALAYVDDNIINEKVSQETIDILIKTKEFMIGQDTEGLASYLSKTIAGKVNFLDNDESEEKLIYGVLIALSGLLDKMVSAVNGTDSEVSTKSMENEEPGFPAQNPKT
jgi:hypothetical protein